MAASQAARIRECVLAILRDTWPQPWPTPDLQDAFAPRDFPRVYTAVTRLWSAGEVAKFADSQRWKWWVAIGDPLGFPRCGHCGREVTPDKGRILWWYGHGGWWCGDQAHFADMISRPWPWPTGEELSETLVVVR